jgi:hypothetical protein
MRQPAAAQAQGTHGHRQTGQGQAHRPGQGHRRRQPRTHGAPDRMVHGKRKVVYQRVRRAAPALAILSAGDIAGLNRTHDPLDLRSSVAYVMDQASSEVLFEKNATVALPIASITKLMTGLLVVQGAEPRRGPDRHRRRRRQTQVHQFAPARRRPHDARQPAAHRPDELGKPRRRRPRPQLSGRHQRLRRGDECQGKRTGHERYALCGFERAVEPERLERARPGQAGR